MEWETTYIEALIEALQPKGHVLEVGFGYASKCIEKYPIESHTIIECHPNLGSEAAAWAEKRAHTRVIQDKWEKVLPTLQVFDTIFFNEFSMERMSETVSCKEKGQAALRGQEELFKKVYEKVPHLKEIHYAEKDVDLFCEQMYRLQPKDLARFLAELRKGGQITEAIYHKMTEKYQLEKKEVSYNPFIIEPLIEEVFTFFKACSEKHMRKGSRFSCFSLDATSKLEKPHFMEHVIANPHFEYQEKWIEVSVPPSCEYYKGKEALIFLIQKMV